MLTGIGNAMFDKRMSTKFVCEPVSDEEAQNIYRGDPFGARAIDTRPKEMFREGFDLCISEITAAEEEEDKEPVDPEVTRKIAPYSLRQDRRRLDRKARVRLDAAAAQAKDLAERAMRKFRRLGGKKRLKEALAYSAAYGGGAILIGANDGSKSWAEELKLDRVRSIDFLTSLEARELTPIAWYEDPLKPKFGEVMLWQITPVTPASGMSGSKIVYVHESRIIHFQGTIVARNQNSLRIGHGDSIFTRVKGVLRDFNIGWSAASIILHEFTLATMKIKGLAEMVSTDAQKKLLARMAAIQLARSVAKVTLIDKEEEFTRDTASVAGLADLLEKLMQQLAAAFDMPVTVLMGMSPAGLNATGASDIRQWYDDIKNEQTEKIEPALERVFSIIFRVLNKGKEPAVWSIEFRKLWQESAKEQAETRNLDANTDEKNIMNGIYTAEECRRSRYGGDKYGTEIVIDDVDDGKEYSDQELEDYKNSLKPKDPNADPEVQPDPNAPPAPVDPNAPPVDPKAAPKTGATPAPVKGPKAPQGSPEIQKQAMNGAQVEGIFAILDRLFEERIPREVAETALQFCYQAPPEIAKALLGPEGWKPKKEDSPPMPGGGAPIPPAAKPPIPPNEEPKKEEKPV